MKEDKICLLCGEEIDMDDYRNYEIKQIEDRTSHFVYVHENCITMGYGNAFTMKLLEGDMEHIEKLKFCPNCNDYASISKEDREWCEAHNTCTMCCIGKHEEE